ncbi:MAG: response regulator transcription factor [Lachnospiraceae bacterium]|nr:response regulator transcription factor [Lachnospiraceae bacterium]
MKLLLVEDNEAIILGLEYLLKEEGFSCKVARTRREAEKAVCDEGFDLILLDVTLPDGDGFALCRSFKKNGDIPVIFLTAKEEERDVVQGFELGADDYIIKPFRNRELISRIRNVLRRCGKGNEVLSCGTLKMDTAAGKVYREGVEISLTKLEYKILHIMMKNQNRLFSREEILSQIWDVTGNFVEDNTLTVTVKRLREKIGDDGSLIKTIRGIGYRMDRKTEADHE